MPRRWIGILIALILLGCVVSPFVETAVHSDGSILDGQDNDTTVAIIALCFALALAASALVWTFCIGIRREIPVSANGGRFTFPTRAVDSNLDTSPPLALRI